MLNQEPAEYQQCFLSKPNLRQLLHKSMETGYSCLWIIENVQICGSILLKIYYSWNRMGRFISLFYKLHNLKNNDCGVDISRSFPSVLISLGCCNKSPQAGCLKTTESYPILALEAREVQIIITWPKSVLAGPCFLGKPLRGVCSLPLPSGIPRLVTVSLQ